MELSKTDLYLLSPVFVPLSLDLSQHVVQSPHFRGDGVNLDPDSVRVRPRHPGPVQGLKALPLPPDVRKAPDGARQPGLGSVRLHGHLPAERVSALRPLQGLLQLGLQQLVPPLQLVHFGEEAAEAQVEGFQHMDVGAQVVAQGAGHRARPGGDAAADRPGQGVGEKQRTHVGKQQQDNKPSYGSDCSEGNNLTSWVSFFYLRIFLQMFLLTMRML